MGDKSAIQWTDATWNPVVGCSIVSPACTNCYAMAQAGRIERMQPGGHYAGTTKSANGKAVWTGELHQAPEHILNAPLRWKRPRRIFVNSMSDLFHENVPDEWIDRVFAVMALAPQHVFQVLTKRPKRMQAYLDSRSTLDDRGHPAEDIRVQLTAWLATPSWRERHPAQAAMAPRGKFCAAITWPLPNVWLGVTAEDQSRADERIPDLLATPAAMRFVSVEPMLGSVDLTRLRVTNGDHFDSLRGEWIIQLSDEGDDITKRYGLPSLDWVICGGESGPSARPMHPDWARSLRDQCEAAGVPFLMKQWGEWAPLDAMPRAQTICGDHGVISRNGQWRLDSDIAAPPEHVFMFRVGKARAGRLLDGCAHDAFPLSR